MALAAALCALLVSSSGSAAGAPAPRYDVPHDFLGIVDELLPSVSDYWKVQDLKAMRRAGVEILRQDFDWAAIEPRQGTYDFAGTDALISAAAKAGVRVLAVLNGPSPAWAVTDPRSCTRVSRYGECPPRSMASFASFAATVARRYGPDGTFWRSHPALHALPINSWEIWNEPNFDLYWDGRPSAAAYASMLRATAPAIRAVNAHAEIVTAGVANPGNPNEGIAEETYIKQFLAQRPRPPFDTFAVHQYDYNATEVIADVKGVRSLLDAVGLRSTPIWLTEFGWASAGQSSPFTVGPKRQAQYVLATIVTLAREARSWHIRGLVYYDWQDERIYAGGGANPWQFHTGLVTFGNVAKPAQSAYYQAAGVIGALP
ncbi:MAG: beta-galactosidase [Solirubrobacteraceae bacterium]